MKKLMGLIEKLETLINNLIFKLLEFLWRLVPSPIKKIVEKYKNLKERFISFIKNIPSLLKKYIPILINKAKTKISTTNFRPEIFDELKVILDEYTKNNKNAGKFKKIIILPWIIASKWFEDLSTAQTLGMFIFSAASILAVIGIGFSGQKIANLQREASRMPASVEEEIPYARPVYYKKQTRHVEISNLRLPVYFANINEVKSVDIDFVATTSNRETKMFLDKHDFQLRDHLILQVEPSVAAFPLEEEGKDIIRKKIIQEINDFLKTYEIDGSVSEVRITYVLAN
jgi:flagellar basal body-associated protein FliL